MRQAFNGAVYLLERNPPVMTPRRGRALTFPSAAVAACGRGRRAR